MDTFKKGQRNYQKCQVRNEPTQEPVSVAHGLSANSFFGWFGAKLNEDASYPRTGSIICARGETQVTVTGTAEQAKDAVADNLGRKACKGCVFANKTPQEVTVMQRARDEALGNAGTPIDGGIYTAEIVQGQLVDSGEPRQLSQAPHEQ